MRFNLFILTFFLTLVLSKAFGASYNRDIFIYDRDENYVELKDSTKILRLDKILNIPQVIAPLVCDGTTRGSQYFDDTENSLLVCDGVGWVSIGGGLENWIAGTDYKEFDTVIENETVWQANQASSDTPDLDISKWNQIGAKKASEYSMGSCLFSGGDFSYPTSPDANVTVSAGIGWIKNPVVNGKLLKVTWPETILTAGASALTRLGNLVVIDISPTGTEQEIVGTPIILEQDETSEIRRNNVFLGAIATNDAGTGLRVTYTQEHNHCLDKTNDLTDMGEALGFVKSGFGMTGVIGTLGIDVTAGVAFKNGIGPFNYAEIPALPNLTQFTKIYRDGAGDWIRSADTLDFTQYDDGSGTLQPVAQANDAVVIPLFFSARTRVWYYQVPQKSYVNYATALSRLGADFIEYNKLLADNTLFMGYIVAKRDATNFDDPDGTAKILPSGKLASVGASGAGGAGGAGDVVGPSVSANNNIATYDGVTGKLIKDASSVSILAGVFNTVLTKFEFLKDAFMQKVYATGFFGAGADRSIFADQLGKDSVAIGTATLTPTGDVVNVVSATVNDGFELASVTFPNNNPTITAIFDIEFVSGDWECRLVDNNSVEHSVFGFDNKTGYEDRQLSMNNSSTITTAKLKCIDLSGSGEINLKSVQWTNDYFKSVSINNDSTEYYAHTIADSSQSYSPCFTSVIDSQIDGVVVENSSSTGVKITATEQVKLSAIANNFFSSAYNRIAWIKNDDSVAIPESGTFLGKRFGFVQITSGNALSAFDGILNAGEYIVLRASRGAAGVEAARNTLQITATPIGTSKGYQGTAEMAVNDFSFKTSATGVVSDDTKNQINSNCVWEGTGTYVGNLAGAWLCTFDKPLESEPTCSAGVSPSITQPVSADCIAKGYNNYVAYKCISTNTSELQNTDAVISCDVGEDDYVEKPQSILAPVKVEYDTDYYADQTDGYSNVGAYAQFTSGSLDGDNFSIVQSGGTRLVATRDLKLAVVSLSAIRSGGGFGASVELYDINDTLIKQSKDGNPTAGNPSNSVLATKVKKGQYFKFWVSDPMSEIYASAAAVATEIEYAAVHKSQIYKNAAKISTPTSATESCVAGTVKADTSYIYVCAASNTWLRSAITTW